MDTQKHYDRIARMYDALFGMVNKLYGFDEMHYRQLAISKLSLQQGDSVIEIGCGTGRNFEALGELVGEQGKIIGVDISSNMLRKACDRVKQKGWSNVELYTMDVNEIERIRSIRNPDDALLSTLVYCTLWHDTKLRESFLTLLDESERFSVMDANSRWTSSKLMKYALKATSYLFGMHPQYWDKDTVQEFEKIEDCSIEEAFHRMLFIAYK